MKPFTIWKRRGKRRLDDKIGKYECIKTRRNRERCTTEASHSRSYNTFHLINISAKAWSKNLFNLDLRLCMRIRFTSKSKGDPVPTSKFSNSFPDITKDTTASDGILSKISRSLLPLDLSILSIGLDERPGNALPLSKETAREMGGYFPYFPRLVQSSPIEPKRLACSQDVLA